MLLINDVIQHVEHYFTLGMAASVPVHTAPPIAPVTRDAASFALYSYKPAHQPSLPKAKYPHEFDIFRSRLMLATPALKCRVCAACRNTVYIVTKPNPFKETVALRSVEI